MVQSKMCRPGKLSQRLLWKAQEERWQIENFQPSFIKPELISHANLCPRYTVYRMFHMCSCSERITLTWTTASDLVYCALGGCISMCKCGLLIHNTLQNHYSESCRVLLRSRHVKIGRVPTGSVIWENLIKGP